MDEMSKKSLILLDFDGTIVDGDIAFTMLENTLNKVGYLNIDNLEILELIKKNYNLKYSEMFDKES